MCKVLISNYGNNYFNASFPSKEFDIPSEMVPILENIFSELNQMRKTAVEPNISIHKI